MTMGRTQTQLARALPHLRLDFIFILDSYIVGNRHLLEQGEGVLSERIPLMHVG
jgi:hypothetical protein